MCYLLLNIYLVLLESFLCAKLWKCNFSVQFEQNWQGVSGLFDSKKTSIGLFIFSFQTSFLSVSATSSLLNFVRKRYDIFLIVYNKLVEDQWTAFPLNYSDLSEPFFCFHSFHATHPNINFRKLFQFGNKKINPKLKFSPVFFSSKTSWVYHGEIVRSICDATWYFSLPLNMIGIDKQKRFSPFAFFI